MGYYLIKTKKGLKEKIVQQIKVGGLIRLLDLISPKIVFIRMRLQFERLVFRSELRGMGAKVTDGSKGSDSDII